MFTKPPPQSSIYISSVYTPPPGVQGISWSCRVGARDYAGGLGYLLHNGSRGFPPRTQIYEVINKFIPKHWQSPLPKGLPPLNPKFFAAPVFGHFPPPRDNTIVFLALSFLKFPRPDFCAFFQIRPFPQFLPIFSSFFLPPVRPTPSGCLRGFAR